jgi:glycogen synthase
MRILFWSDTFWPIIGGVEVLGGYFIRALKARGHEIIVVARRDTDDLPDVDCYHGIPVYRFPFRTAVQARNLGRVVDLRERLAAVVRAFKPDVVHVYHSGPGLYFYLLACGSRSAPVIMTLHQTYVDPLLTPDSVRGRLMRSARWISSCSASVLEVTRQQLPEIKSYSSVISNSLEMPTLEPAPLPFDPPRVLCLGRVIQQKGFDVSLTAWKTLAGRFPGARLVIAGNGLARPDLEQQARRLGLDCVDFLGWVPPDDVPALINSCTLMLMPSRIEPFGLVALQAAQMGRPIVATRVDGLPEVVVHEKTGWLVDADDSHALAQAIAFLLDHPEIAAELGRAARVRAQELFSWDGHLDAHEDLYRRCVVDAPTRSR